MSYLKNRGFSLKNLALFSICEKIGLRVSARQRKMGDGSMRLCLEVFYPPKNEYIALSEKLMHNELGDAIFTAYLKYYDKLRKFGTIKWKEVGEDVAEELPVEESKPKPTFGTGSFNFKL